MKFKSAKEFLEALASGEKIRHNVGCSKYFMINEEGKGIVDQDNNFFDVAIKEWVFCEPYQEDKSTTIYQVFYRYKNCEHSETEMCESKNQWFIDNECSRSDLDFVHFVSVTIPNEAFIK